MKKELYREICYLFQLIESLEIKDNIKTTIHKSINDLIEALWTKKNLKYFIVYGDTEYTTIEEIDTIEELKKRILEIQNDKWLYLENIIWGEEIEDVA